MPDLTLGFDTSAAHCAAALLLDDRLLVNRVEPMIKGQAERLFPLLSEILDQNGYVWRDLCAIGVGVGPGNFTGIRVSVAAARGLGLSLGVPVIGVTVTEALAWGQTRPCRAIVPGRGDQVIWQDFGTEMSAPAQSARDDLPSGPPPCADHPLAEGIARIAFLRRHAPDLPRPAPYYLRPADAAPARDQGPVILP